MSNLVSDDNLQHILVALMKIIHHILKIWILKLSYEQSRIPTLDLPNCDLEACDGDPQQAYSHLGIRQQIMFYSLDCSTPYCLWDSPCEGSLDAYLKNAAKSFGSRPSILKKRPRDP
ncbi:hypothetical protein AMTRI_Chr12g242050 [Amborella trichopoda]